MDANSLRSSSSPIKKNGGTAAGVARGTGEGSAVNGNDAAVETVSFAHYERVFAYLPVFPFLSLMQRGAEWPAALRWMARRRGEFMSLATFPTAAQLGRLVAGTMGDPKNPRPQLPLLPAQPATRIAHFPDYRPALTRRPRTPMTTTARRAEARAVWSAARIAPGHSIWSASTWRIRS